MKSPSKAQITLRLTKEIDEKLTEQSKRMGISKNAFILMVINNHLVQKAC